MAKKEKTTSITEYRKKSSAELRELLNSRKSDMEKHAVEILKQKEKNVSKMKFIRQDIARIMTVLNEKQKEVNKVDSTGTEEKNA